MGCGTITTSPTPVTTKLTYVVRNEPYPTPAPKTFYNAAEAQSEAKWEGIQKMPPYQSLFFHPIPKPEMDVKDREWLTNNCNFIDHHKGLLIAAHQEISYHPNAPSWTGGQIILENVPAEYQHHYTMQCRGKLPESISFLQSKCLAFRPLENGMYQDMSKAVIDSKYCK